MGTSKDLPFQKEHFENIAKCHSRTFDQVNEMISIYRDKESKRDQNVATELVIEEERELLRIMEDDNYKSGDIMNYIFQKDKI